MITRKPFALFLASLVALTTAGFAQTVKLSTTTLTLSAQMMGTTSAAKNVTLTNTDNVTPLAIDGILTVPTTRKPTPAAQAWLPWLHARFS